MGGIVAYGSYVPHHRIRRSTISAALEIDAGGGARTVASCDEDPTTMGIESARAALGAHDPGKTVRRLLFSTSHPPYLEKTNATAIHAALTLPRNVYAMDALGSVRSGTGTLRQALAAAEPTLAVLSDVRTGLPGSTDERESGDAAVAMLCAGNGDFIAEQVGSGARTAEILDQWRVPGQLAARHWEDRFGEFAYHPLGSEAVREALGSAGLAPGEVDHAIVTGVHSRAARRVLAEIGARPEAAVDALGASVGNTGVAHPALLLASVLDRAGPGETILVTAIADGVDALVFRTTERLPDARQRISLERQIEGTQDDLSYASFASWRGLLPREPPRRTPPPPPASPPTLRSEAWKFAFVASRCACGVRHLPPALVCMSCGRADEMTPEPLQNVRATIATFSVDRLAYTEAPPMIVAVIDFDGGGRFQCELTDADPESVAIGDRVELTARKIHTAGGVHNYFWKARPAKGGG